MKKIFCIEDDHGVRELVLCALGHYGFEAKGFERAADFLEDGGMPDLIILDIMLPDTDGIDFLKQLKASPKYGEVPVVMLTAKSTEFDKITGLDAGADDYMTKPFGVMELVSRINAVLRRCGTKKRERLTIEHIEVDIPSRSVTRRGKSVILTSKEFDILCLLIKRRDTVVTRDELMSCVWGYEYEGATRTVDMHIKTLRQKLGEGGKIIKTVRGMGYMISEH
ncbi:MAG: response regulator transcription factor [Clostridiales bacterium]|nr:response regulator transcription factor [Clostridiales bacterium]